MAPSRPSRRRRCLLGHVVAVAVATAPTTAALAVDTVTIGGPGGIPFRVGCPPGQFLVGLSGRAGAWIDQVALICAPLGDHGDSIGIPSDGPAVGGTGGNAFRMTCPSGYVVGYHGFAREFVASFAIKCQRPGEVGWWVAARVGRPVGGSDFHAADGNCPDLNGADAIIGGAGVFVDRFGLACDPLPRPPPPPPPPVVVTGPPDWLRDIIVDPGNLIQNCRFCDIILQR